jgi:hypothetical protein
MAGDSDGRFKQAIPDDEFVRRPLEESSEAYDDSELEEDDDADEDDEDDAVEEV